MMRTEDYKRELISILFAQKNVVVWTMILVFAGAIGVAFSWPPTFSATSGILVKSKQPEKSPEALESSVPRRFTEITKADLASEIEMLNSPAVVEATLETLRKTHPEVFAGVSGSAAQGALVYRILKNMKTEVVPLSNVVSIVYYDKDPKLAADTLNVLLAEYLKKRAGIYNAGGSGTFFQQQADLYKSRLDGNDETIYKNLDDTGVADPEKELQNNLNLKLAAEGELNRIRNAYLETQATHRRLKESLQSPGIQYFSYLDSFVIVELAKKLTELSSERNRALKTYHPESDIIKTYDEQVNKTADALKAEASEYMKNVAEKLKAMEVQVSTLEATIARYDQENLALRKQWYATNKLNAESQLLRFSYETYVKRAEEESVDGTLGTAGITTRVNILNAAFPSDGPVSPRPAVILPLAALVGLILGVSLAFMREYFDHTFKKPSDVQATTDLPVLFSLSRPGNPAADRFYGLTVLAVVGVLVLVSAYRYHAWLLRYYP